MTGAELIAAERERQTVVHGWDPVNDAAYTRSQLPKAAICYALHAMKQFGGVPFLWPFPARWWKPTEPIRDLVKAGALIAAEIDRLQHAEETRKCSSH